MCIPGSEVSFELECINSRSEAPTELVYRGEVKVLLNWNVYAGEAPTDLEYCTEGAN